MAGLGSPERAGPAPVPATRVELTVSCRQLLDRDTFSKSDPVCVLYTQCPGSNQWREFGRTEVIDNSLNPDFLHKFVLDYCFEERQNLRFDLYDVDSKSPDLSKHDFLGQAFCTLGEIVGSAGSRLEKPLMMGTATMHPRGRRPSPASSSGGVPGKKCGTIILLAEELGNCRDVATLQFSATKLDKKDFFGKSDPFMVFYRSNEDGTFTICHKTEVVRNTLNPIWAAFAIPVRALCNGDHDRAIKVEVYDWDRDGSHDFIGEFTTSYRELARGQSHFNVYEVVNPRKKMKKKKYLNSGTVTLLSFAVEAEHTFLDYIRGGTGMHQTRHAVASPGCWRHISAACAVSSSTAPPTLPLLSTMLPAQRPQCWMGPSTLSSSSLPMVSSPTWPRPRRPLSMLPNCPCPSSSWELARQSLMPWWSWMGTTSASLPVGKWLSVISSRYRPHQCAIWGPPSSPTSKVVGDSLGTSNQRHHSWGALGGTGV
ncbi:copine-5-like isoform X16 [Hirundo rustica]|uniref:copine-5-like isoform X16 n=1 Tax=Hirundo rustica TaxID=43150 RepID=UPI002671EBBC|nr:copine-5-like isoform X16 [Hirundo rustica]